MCGVKYAEPQNNERWAAFLRSIKERPVGRSLGPNVMVPTRSTEAERACLIKRFRRSFTNAVDGDAADVYEALAASGGGSVVKCDRVFDVSPLILGPTLGSRGMGTMNNGVNALEEIVEVFGREVVEVYVSFEQIGVPGDPVGIWPASDLCQNPESS
jgi:hypothetical protein